MPSTLSLAGIFKSDAESLQRAREDASRIHPTDIRAAGNQVEQSVREYLKRMLPPRYYVTSGHLIDSSNIVSPQLDVIIADNFSLPSLLTAKDGTEYVPVTSVYAVGEVKSTYYHSGHYYEKLHDALEQISEMDRPLKENTAFEGIKPSTTITDTVLGSRNRYLNNMFSFLLCVDGNDFEFTRLKDFLVSVDPRLLPNMGVLLNKGIVCYGKTDMQEGISIHMYPGEVPQSDYDWCFAEGAEAEGGSIQGAHLAILYGALIQHLSNSHLGPPNAYRYTSTMSVFRRSSLMWAKTGNQ